MNKEKEPSRPRLRVASFFSGIGGFDLGFQQAKFVTTMQCEINPFCLEILQRHWKDVPRFKDIREITSAEIPISDVWAAGFPCQDVSLARMGPRAGLKGKKSGLFYEFARLIRESRPRVVVIENVPGLLSSHGGRDFEIVIRTLAELGYGVGWRVFNSKDFGVPQSRQRVYIVAGLGEWRTSAEVLFEPQRSQGNSSQSKPDGKKPVSPFKESLGDLVKGPIVPRIAYCLYACSARHTGTDWSRTYVSFPQGKVRRLTPLECEAIQGFPKDWTLPIAQNRNPEEIDTLRYTCLGNAVTVPVAKWLAARIRNSLARQEAAVTLSSALASRLTPAVFREVAV